MSEQRIGNQSKVTLHFDLKLDNGDVIDSTFDKEPATFTVGDGSLLPGFEQSLFGYKAGDKRSTVLPPERAFGRGNEGNLQTMPRKDFDDMELAEGILVIFQDARRNEMPGIVESFNDQEVVVNFNHPLAGRDITFEVEIIQVDNPA